MTYRLVPQSPVDASTWNFRLEAGAHLHLRPATATTPARIDVVSSRGTTVATRR